MNSGAWENSTAPATQSTRSSTFSPELKTAWKGFMGAFFATEPCADSVNRAGHRVHPLGQKFRDIWDLFHPATADMTLEIRVDRLGDLERLALTFEGVEKVYAIAAGREIRVFVNPGKVSDLAVHKLARDIAKRVQEEVKYPGEIKINVIRENRVVEFAR